MCLLLFGWRALDDGLTLAVAANRDEYHARPTAPAALQPEGWVGGRDLVAGGTWLGVGSGGRFAALTNVREPSRTPPPGAPSRGDLVRGFLEGGAGALEYARGVAAERYAGFNLLLVDGEAAAYVGNRDPDGARPLEPGVYGLSNAPRFDAPWPKVRGGEAALAALGPRPTVDGLLAVLADRAVAPDDELPETGVGLELERRLSPRFLVGEAYGTRCSTAVLVRRDGAFSLAERRFGPDGRPSGETRLEIPARGALP